MHIHEEKCICKKFKGRRSNPYPFIELVFFCDCVKKIKTVLIHSPEIWDPGRQRAESWLSYVSVGLESDVLSEDHDFRVVISKLKKVRRE